MLHSDGFGIISFCRLISDEESAYDFLQFTGLINFDDPPYCEKCTEVMRLVPVQGKKCQFVWHCSRPCRNNANVTSNTFVDGCRIPYLKVLEIILHWFFQVPVTTAAGKH